MVRRSNPSEGKEADLPSPPPPCPSYQASARVPGAPDTGASHVGFRCLMTKSMQHAKSKQETQR